VQQHLVVKFASFLKLKRPLSFSDEDDNNDDQDDADYEQPVLVSLTTDFSFSQKSEWG